MRYVGTEVTKLRNEHRLRFVGMDEKLLSGVFFTRNEFMKVIQDWYHGRN